MPLKEDSGNPLHKRKFPDIAHVWSTKQATTVVICARGGQSMEEYIGYFLHRRSAYDFATARSVWASPSQRRTDPASHYTHSRCVLIGLIF